MHEKNVVNIESGYEPPVNDPGPAPGWKPRFHVAVTVDGVDSVTVTSTDNSVGALACAIDDALACVTDNQEKPCR